MNTGNKGGGKQTSKYQPPTKMQSKGDEKGTKRTASEVSNDSIIDVNDLQKQLDTMTEDIKSLREDIKQIIKKNEIKTIIKETVSQVMSEMEEKLEKRMNTMERILQEKVDKSIDKIVDERTKEIQNKIDFLEFNDTQMKEEVDSLRKKYEKSLENLEEKVRKHELISMEANKRSNRNEQYSRKNNVKVMNVTEGDKETEAELTKKLQDIMLEHDVKLEENQIVAIHRIPTKRGQTKPVLIKLRNNCDKTMMMRKRKELKQKGYRLVDDVTSLNTGLMNRLSLNPQIESTWYFNGTVFGMTRKQERIRFDLYDDIDEVIKSFRDKKTDLGRY